VKQEILAVGKWNDIEFTLDDLVAIKQSFDALKGVHKVPLKFGHNDEQPLTDGLPALGWVDALELVGDKLVATLSDVPEIVARAMEKKLYRSVSVEIDGGVSHKGSSYKWVLSGLALLGADIPAVNTLNDLAQYMSRGDAMRAERRVSFSTVQGTIKQEPKKMAMTDEEKAELEALRKQNAALIGEKVALSAKLTEKEAADKARNDQEKTAKFSADKKAIGDDLEKLVTEAKITPAQRDKTLELIKDGDEGSLGTARAVMSALSISPGIKAKTDEQGKAKSDADKELEGKSPSAVLASKVRGLMATDARLTFAAASQRVMDAHPELVKAYVNENDAQAA
jgi:hypothetical protein